MDRKYAIFVEGLTEQLYVIKLIEELAGNIPLKFEISRQKYGKLESIEVRFNSPENPKIHILVANCCTDNQVKSQIKDQYGKLKEAGYLLIIGLRDVFPLTIEELPKLESHLNTGLPNDSIPIRMHLAVMEIEAWFLEELTHFTRIDSQITLQNLTNAGFDPDKIRAHTLPNPADTLDRIYSQACKRYKKSKKHIQRTVDALSYEEVYLNVRDKSPHLNSFISSLELIFHQQCGTQ